jgi:hypothetical protein
MRLLLAVLVVSACFGALASVAVAEQHITIAPPGVDILPPGPGDRVPCDTQLRYDDGVDDTPGSGPTLGWYTSSNYQFLGVRFTPPADQSYKVQSASWYSDFWITAGNVDVTVTEWNNPSNTTTATIAVTGAGTWEVEFATPICIPQGGEYVVMLCPQRYAFGVVGQDLSAPDGRNYWSATDCGPVNASSGDDYMLWSCVTPCGATPIETHSWGHVKSLYR